MASTAGDTAEVVAVEETLDEREMLGPECHYVCCMWQKRPGKVVTICGIDVTDHAYNENAVASCPDCIEGDMKFQRCKTHPYCVELES